MKNKKHNVPSGSNIECFLYSDQKNPLGFLGPRKSIDFRGNQGFSDFSFLIKVEKEK